MSKSYSRNGVTKKQGDKKDLIVNNITIRSADRSPKDIQTWRDAHRNAESVHMPNRSKLYDLYSDVMLDGHLSGIIGKRFDAVLNKKLLFERNNKPVDGMDKVLRSLTFRNIIQTILETRLWGLSGLEFIPGAAVQFVKVPRKHIKIEKGVIAKEQSSDIGFTIADYPNIWIVGEKDDLGLLLKCSPYALYKRGGMADWSQYIEIFGMPVRVVKYDAYDTQTKIELDKAISESGSALEIRIPKQADFEMLDGKSSNGNGELQERFKKALNNEMSIIILGNTETTSSDNGGSNAKSQTHSDQQKEILKSDMTLVLSMLNSEFFLNILKTYGLPVDGGEFTFEKEIDTEAIKAQVDIVKSVKDMGTPVDDDYIYQLTGIPKPANYDALVKERQQQPPSLRDGDAVSILRSFFSDPQP